jgi:hypothetical protein
VRLAKVIEALLKEAGDWVQYPEIPRRVADRLWREAEMKRHPVCLFLTRGSRWWNFWLIPSHNKVSAALCVLSDEQRIEFVYLQPADTRGILTHLEARAQFAYRYIG